VNDRIGFMQGRLSPLVDGKIQAFPWEHWESELPAASLLDLRLMEWTLDQQDLYSNPLMTQQGKARIGELCRQHKVSIPSLTGDCFMQAPFWKAGAQEAISLKRDFLEICRACHVLGIRQVVVPLVDNGSLENREQEDQLVNTLSGWKDHLSLLGVQVIFESDFSPRELARFIARLDKSLFGINYDIGNSAAQGWKPEEEFQAYGRRILNVHVKDRKLGGTTVPLGTGDAQFTTVFEEIDRLNYTGNFILQTARAADDSHAATLARYRDMTLDWARRYLQGGKVGN
jgi:L-ribulose-5-phosphate 3-epimerase